MEHIGLDRTVKCLLCSSNEEYLCEVHNHILGDYSLSDSKLTLAVIGDASPRANNLSIDEFPVIVVVERPKDLIKYVEKELDDEEQKDFKFLVLLTTDSVNNFTSRDMIDLLNFNYRLCPISCFIFENNNSRETFKQFYNNWNAPLNYPLPVFAELDDLGHILEYTRDASIRGNKFIYLTCAFS